MSISNFDEIKRELYERMRKDPNAKEEIKKETRQMAREIEELKQKSKALNSIKKGKNLEIKKLKNQLSQLVKNSKTAGNQVDQLQVVEDLKTKERE